MPPNPYRRQPNINDMMYPKGSKQPRQVWGAVMNVYKAPDTSPVPPVSPTPTPSITPTNTVTPTVTTTPGLSPSPTPTETPTNTPTTTPTSTLTPTPTTSVTPTETPTNTPTKTPTNTPTTTPTTSVTPTTTKTPTPTSSPIPSCNYYRAQNDSFSGTLQYGYTDCDGTVYTFVVLPPSTSIDLCCQVEPYYMAGVNSFSVTNLGACPSPTPTPTNTTTPTITPSITPTNTPTNTTTPTNTPTTSVTPTETPTNTPTETPTNTPTTSVTPTSTPVTPTPTTTPTPTPTPSPLVSSITYVTNSFDAVNRTSYTFSDISYGGAGLIVISVDVIEATISSVTVGGVSATLAVSRVEPTKTASSIYYIRMTGGTSANIVVNISGTATACSIGINRIQNNNSDTPVYTSGSTCSGPSCWGLSANLPAFGNNGLVVGNIAAWGVNGGINSWTGPIQRYNSINMGGEGSSASGASRKVNSATTYSVSASWTFSEFNQKPGSIVSAVWI